MKFVNCSWSNDFKIHRNNWSQRQALSQIIYLLACTTGSVCQRLPAEVFICIRVHKAHHEKVAQFSEIKDYRVIASSTVCSKVCHDGWRLLYGRSGAQR